ncbi:MAG: DUF371 domain-containing protein [Desulfurococcaceae archaeon]
MACLEVIKAKGHPNIKASHRTTFEVTKESFLTLRGDCIIGVSADKAAFDLSEEFKECLRKESSTLLVVLEVEEIRDFIQAKGHPDLLLCDRSRVIVRKSNYIEPATIGLMANKAAQDIDRELIARLKDPLATLSVVLICY